MNIKRAKEEIKNTIEAYLLRDRYGVRPTAAGEQLLPAVRDLLQAAGRLEGQIAAQSGQRRENIRVAAYSRIK